MMKLRKMKTKKVVGYGILGVTAMSLMACPGKPPEVEPTEPLPDVIEEPVDTTSQVDNTPQVDPLETERARLEKMLNELMENDVYFDYDKSKLTTEARDLLSQVGDILIKNNGKFDIVVEGHTDTQGTESYNMALGSKRANAVRGYLVDYGVAKDVINTTSFGEQSPKAEGDSESSHAKNRRASFQVNIK